MKKKLFSSIYFTALLISATVLFAAPLGDVNSDGTINIVDALQVAQYAVGFRFPGFDARAADVDLNEIITITDALIIAQYAVGTVQSLPPFSQNSGIITGTTGYMETDETSMTFRPLPGVTVTWGNRSTESDEDGNFSLHTEGKDAGILSCSKPGYFCKSQQIAEAIHSQLILGQVILHRENRHTISGSAGGYIQSASGPGVIIIPPHSLTEPGGELYPGECEIHTHISLSRDQDFLPGFPASFTGKNREGESVKISSYGLLAIKSSDSRGNILNLEKGKKAEIRLPVHTPDTAPATLTLWFLNETTGEWQEEGQAERIAQEYVGNISHFGCWNFGVPLTGRTFRITGKVVDEEGQPVSCAIVKAYPEKFKGIYYNQITGRDGSYSLEVQSTEENSLFYLEAAQGAAESLPGLVTSQGNDITGAVLPLRHPGKRLDLYNSSHFRLTRYSEIFITNGENKKVITLMNNAPDPVRISRLQLEGSDAFTVDGPVSFSYDIDNKNSKKIILHFTPTGNRETGQLLIHTNCPYHQPAFILNLVGGAEPLPPATSPVQELDYIIEFPDWGLEYAVRDTIGKPEGYILQSELSHLTSLKAESYAVENLQGLEYFASLEELDLLDNKITDISPLAGLTNLTCLELSGNEIEDLTPLSGLVNLSTLMLRVNHISDINALAPLVRLKHLELVSNRLKKIDTMPLLPELKYLDLADNQISDISPLAGLVNLHELQIKYNQVMDASPLQRLKKLEILDLSLNRTLNAASLSGLVSLKHLNLSATKINSLSALASLTDLEELVMNNNGISDINALAGLGNLKHLALPYNDIFNLEPLSGMVHLNYLDLSYNNIFELKGMENLINLTDLTLTRNEIQNINALHGLHTLTNLDLSLNAIHDISALIALTNLNNLNLLVNHVSDISPLQNMQKMRSLTLTNNQISDISPLAGMNGLTHLYLGINNITDICPLDSLVNCQYINIRENPLSSQSLDECVPRLEALGISVSY